MSLLRRSYLRSHQLTFDPIAFDEQQPLIR